MNAASTTDDAGPIEPPSTETSLAGEAASSDAPELEALGSLSTPNLDTAAFSGAEDTTRTLEARPAGRGAAIASEVRAEIEVTQPFGLRLEDSDVEVALDTASDDAGPETASAPAAVAPLKPRGFVIADDGALLTTPVAAATPNDAPSGSGDDAGHEALPAASTTVAPRPTPRAPIELDDSAGASDEPMQLASTWEFVGWQGGDDTGTIGHEAETTWADRVVDIEGPAVAPANTEVPLASAWDFIQQPWQPQSQEPEEVVTALLAAAASASTGTPSGGPSVTAEQVLAALDAVSTQGMLGKVVLAYCAGRFQRAFLFGESLGLARVGHAWGPGSDSEAVAGLKVDLEAPSLLQAAMASMAPRVFSAPECAQDEALFAALGGPGAAHLAVIAIRNQGHAVAFIVADHGSEPPAAQALDELAQIARKASEAFAQLPASRRV